ncbi:hypothetical protein OQA88_11044 [Cercophora sp. LCS_1]
MPAPLYRAVLRRHVDQQLRQLRCRRAHSTKSDPSGKTKVPQPEGEIPTPNNVPTLPFWQRLGPLTRAAQAYARSQRKRPYVTQLCMSVQSIGGKDYDPLRTVRSLIIGGISSIPGFKWFVWLSKNFNYPSKLVSLATKVVINQACFTPVFNTYFFGMQALLAGETLATTWDRIKQTVPVSVVNSCKLWPAVTAFMFTFVPLEYRSLFSGCIAVGWQTYLSLLNRRAEESGARKMAVTVETSGMDKMVA